MAAAEVQPPPSEAPGLPDYLLNPDAVLGDESAKWRYGRAPDYSKTRKVYEDSKTQTHEAASLPNLVENLVKNWEVEASFKTSIEDWRTIDRPNYTFAINGGPPQSAEHMLKVGTYNAIIAPNEYYSPENSDFATSHKTFKRMMPTFAWEVLEVYSGPPVVAFKWRHWGTMKNDYVGFNDKGEKVTAKAHGGNIDIQGITVAKVNDKVQLQSVETWFDPMEMFRQIAPNGIVNKVIQDPTSTTTNTLSDSESEEVPTSEKTAQVGNPHEELRNTVSSTSASCPFLAGNSNSSITPLQQATDAVTASGASTEQKLKADEKATLEPGAAVVAKAESSDAVKTREEMEVVTLAEERGYMNAE